MTGPLVMRVKALKTLQGVGAGSSLMLRLCMCCVSRVDVGKPYTLVATAHTCHLLDGGK